MRIKVFAWIGWALALLAVSVAVRLDGQVRAVPVVSGLGGVVERPGERPRSALCSTINFMEESPLGELCRENVSLRGWATHDRTYHREVDATYTGHIIDATGLEGQECWISRNTSVTRHGVASDQNERFIRWPARGRHDGAWTCYSSDAPWPDGRHVPKILVQK